MSSQPVHRTDPLDLAVIGAGAAGTWVAHAIQRERPDWSIALFERSNQIGGRLRSVKVPDLEHPIELGGMRYLTSHRRVASVIEEFGIRTRAFDTRGGPERSFLRGHIGNGPADPEAGAGYDLGADERGRSAIDLVREAFLKVVPDAESLDTEQWRQLRSTGRYLERRLINWSIAEVISTVRSPEGHRFVTDAFGYDSGLRPHNAADAIQFLLGGNDPTTEARVPVDGMDRIPRELATRFETGGGPVRLGHDLRRLAADDGLVRLHFEDGGAAAAHRVVLALPIRALRALAADSPVIDTSLHRRIYDSVEGFAATKLYLWFERPWWRADGSGVAGIRTTTDLPIRKVFYFDSGPDLPAAILAAYTDGLDNAPILGLAGPASDGAPAPRALLATAMENLRAIHPDVDIPPPMGSAFMHWGVDPREIAWTFWRSGFNSDEMMQSAVQPDQARPIYIAGETFSRSQSWVEGALETAEAVTGRLLATP